MSNEVQRRKMHPHKFTLWVALASIVMMFAGLTSAYIVKRDQPNWTSFELPKLFWISTLAIVLSSVTIHLAQQSFRRRDMMKYRALMTATAALATIFLITQVIGFQQVNAIGIRMVGSGSPSSGSFLLAIVGLHMLHVLGGIVAIVVLFFRAFSRKTRNYNPMPVEITATYWHFVDILWIYLFIFLNWIR
jgi:cytochrome c oxidase subunit III